jgi:hypothetical protein
METRNLGLVKGTFRQTTAPIRTDVLWYDTTVNVLKLYNIITLKWQPVQLYLTGAVTDGAPTNAELNTIIGITAVVAGAGYKCTITDTTGTTLVYLVESDGANWQYVVMTKAV